MVVLSRSEATRTRTAAMSKSHDTPVTCQLVALYITDMEQVVPNCMQGATCETSEMEVKYATNEDGVKLFELFTGDDIFAHHEE